MSERVTQIVKATVLDEQDTNEYRVVGMVSDYGFFAYVQTRPSNSNSEWLQDFHVNQYQVWESDTPDFMNAVDLRTNEHAREWFSGQGYELDTDNLLTNCCGSEYVWLTCDECEQSDEPHDYAICDNCGGDVDD
jgi:hypothetical protein